MAPEQGRSITWLDHAAPEGQAGDGHVILIAGLNIISLGPSERVAHGQLV